MSVKPALTLFLLLYCSILAAQNLPRESSIYDYLKRVSLKYDVDYESSHYPQHRLALYKNLGLIQKNSSSLSQLEKEQLAYHLNEFSYESILHDSINAVEHLNIVSTVSGKRFNVLEYISPDFYFNLNPLFGLSEFNNGINSFFWKSGIYIYGYYKNNWGYSFQFIDNHYYEIKPDLYRNNSRLPGYGFKKVLKNGLEFDDVEASLSYNWNSGSFCIAKEHIHIGSGRESNIILSSKAPSYPYFSFELKPSEWLGFKYLYGVLQSGIVDSTSILKNGDVKTSYNSIPKYIVSHYLEINPITWANLIIGESIIYSGDIKPIYFIPFIFFRMADHYIMGNANSGDNAQLYADLSINLPSLRSTFYTTIYVDELSLVRLFKGGNLASLAYTAGIETADLIFDNSSINVEYTRLNPFVYRNGELAEDYTSYEYQLGHWAGSNSDIISIKYYQQLTRPLAFILDLYYYRKGGTELPNEQYKYPYPGFLYGAKRKESYVSLEVEYEFMHTLKASFVYQFQNITDEDKSRTQVSHTGDKQTLIFQISYGL